VSEASPDSATPAAVCLTFKDGGWVLLAAGVLVTAVIVWAFAGVLSGHQRIGGSDVASYGFDLTTCLVERGVITPSGQPRDFLRPLTVERTMPGATMAEFNARTRKRYVVSDDRVVGVQLGSETRAYPLYLLNGHEVIEDTLGGIPIAVTYSPLCDAVNVFDRRVGEGTIHLRVSGLLHNANSLLYDAKGEEEPGTDETPSLWRQLDGRAISGPHAKAGHVLTPIANVAVTTWSDWLKTHPSTDVPERDPGKIRLYDGISYVRDHALPTIGFPVQPEPPAILPLKSTVLFLRVGSSEAVHSVEALRAAAVDGVYTCTMGGETLAIHLPNAPEPVWRVVHDASTPVFARSAFWFAASSILGVKDLDPLAPSR
jgi:hypothetical protein